MSYDIILLTRIPGESFEEALERLEEGPLETAAQSSDELRERWTRIERRLRDIWGADMVSGVDDDGAEASDPRTGLTVMLFANQAAVTFPYWTHDDREGFQRQIAAVVGVVVGETGWVAYDPQVDAPFNGVAEEITADVTERMASITGEPATAGAARSNLSRATLLPASRSRYLRYLVSGLVCLVGGGAMVVTGPSASAEWLPLCLGAVNVGVAARIRRRMGAADAAG